MALGLNGRCVILAGARLVFLCPERTSFVVGANPRADGGSVQALDG